LVLENRVIGEFCKVGCVPVEEELKESFLCSVDFTDGDGRCDAGFSWKAVNFWVSLRAPGRPIIHDHDS
jgi:hypothetical protein